MDMRPVQPNHSPRSSGTHKSRQMVIDNIAIMNYHDLKDFARMKDIQPKRLKKQELQDVVVYTTCLLLIFQCVNFEAFIPTKTKDLIHFFHNQIVLSPSMSMLATSGLNEYHEDRKNAHVMKPSSDAASSPGTVGSSLEQSPQPVMLEASLSPSLPDTPVKKKAKLWHKYVVVPALDSIPKMGFDATEDDANEEEVVFPVKPDGHCSCSC